MDIFFQSNNISELENLINNILYSYGKNILKYETYN